MDKTMCCQGINGQRVVVNGQCAVHVLKQNMDSVVNNSMQWGKYLRSNNRVGSCMETQNWLFKSQLR